jgi:hypothetical protein
VPHPFFAEGSSREFKEYFTGSSSVAVSSIEEICDWLLGCEFKTDLELFQKADYWQHPLSFEQLRKGDCDDHALWAWRKLVELGKDAELFSGMRLEQDGSWAGHAWVVINEPERLVLDSAVKDRARMLVSLRAVKAALRPHFAVNRNLSTRAYNGWLQTLVYERKRARAKSRDAVA